MVDIDLLLSWGATYKKVGRGEIIFMEGTSSSWYHQLVSGTVKWVNINDEGKEFLQIIIEKGECFGELPLFDDNTYAATAIAESDCTLIRLPKQSFIQMIKENSDIHFAFTRLITERLRFKFFILKELAFHDPEHRIKALFDYFRIHKKYTCPDCNVVRLTRQQIADMTGLRVETVIRTIRNMNDKGELKIQKGKVYLQKSDPVYC